MSTTPKEDLSSILGHFGPYGGRFVPEALIGALEELEEAHRTSQKKRTHSTIVRTNFSSPAEAFQSAAAPQ